MRHLQDCSQSHFQASSIAITKPQIHQATLMCRLFYHTLLNMVLSSVLQQSKSWKHSVRRLEFICVARFPFSAKDANRWGSWGHFMNV